ncbi:transducin beta-like protein 3 [Schistocerca gregaria]|uniref:transducin beta-like protein 3 n=1 Tax=Schistocerca gregaria TaxID=7010 RepID=UPI00211E5E33|nr:transducin beta-like protein 3 [Schistocerca gregaria]
MAVVTDIQLVNDCPTGKKLVTVGRDQIVSIYNVDNQKFTLYTTIPVYESIEACIVLGERALYPRTSAPKPPGSLDVLVAGESGRLKIWNSKTSTCVWEQKDPSVPVDYLILAKKTQAEPTQKSDRDFSSSNPEQSQLPPDRQDALVVVTQDRNMHVYSADTLKLTTTIVGYNDEIMDLAHISQDEIAVAINSTCLHLFKLPSFNSRVLGMTDSKENTSNICHKEPILALAVSPCQQWIATAGKDQILIVWCIALNQAVAQLTGHTGAVLATQFCGKTPHYLASGSQDTTVKVWDLSAILKDTPNPTPPPTSQRISASLATVKAHAKDVNCLTISPNNALLATGSQDKTIKLYSLNKLHQRLLVDRGTLQGHKRGVWDLAFSPVDKVLASCSADQTVKLWNIRDLTCIKTFQGHTASVLHVRFITHGLQLLSAGADSLVKLWNIHDNECVNTFDVHEDKIWGLSVEPGSQGASFVTGGSDSLMCLWQDNTEQEIEEEARRRDQDILSTQHLENLTLSEKYTEAVKLSLHLDRPFQTLQALQSMQADPSEEKVRNSLKTLIADLTYEQLQKLLKYVKDWNTNSKYALVSHRILYYIFTTFSPDSLIQLPYMKETLQALIPYTIRHSQRVNRLLQNSYILDYMLQHMSLLPDLDNIDASTEGYRTQLTNAAPAGTEASAGETS